MALAVQARLDAQFGVDCVPAVHDAPALSPAALPGDIRLSVYDDLSAIEQDWRAFEQHADCTVFQSFDWLATWQRHIGARDGTMPAIVVGRDGAGDMLFIFPLSIRAASFARELTWLGSDLCDYNTPLLAPAFSERFDRAQFISLWENITQRLQDNARLQFDFINLTKMPEIIGTQQNPMRHLAVTINPSGAYLTHLADNWEMFYTAKRSSATRRRDRTKRARLAKVRDIKLVNPADRTETLGMLDTLMQQKTRSFAHKGVANLFARPGYVAFYRALATDPKASHLAHVSTLMVGTIAAALNLGLTYRGCYYHLLASYDDGEVSRFGAGTAHLQDLLHLAIDRGFRIFDFTIGDERYKRDWSDTVLTLYDFIA